MSYYHDDDGIDYGFGCFGNIREIFMNRNRGFERLPPLGTDNLFGPSQPTPPVFKTITAIISPYHMGVCGKEVACGPNALIQAGLLEALRQLGLIVYEIVLEPVDEFEGEIGRSFELHRRTSKAVTRAVESNSFPLILSGNSSSTVGVMSGISNSRLYRDTELPGCLWFDAHDDYNTPDTILSCYLDAMGIAMLEGEAWKALLETIPGFRPLNLKRKLVHCGMRDVTEEQRDRVVHAGFPIVWGSTEEKVNFKDELQSLLIQKGASPRVVHLDLDCLDTSVGIVNKYAAPGGLSKQDLVGCMDMVPARSWPLSLTIASYDPSCDVEGKIPPVAVVSAVTFFKSLMRFGVLTPKAG
jgi:arginase